MLIEDIKFLITNFFKTRPYVVANRWVMTNCPFATVFHADHDDKKFSFGISVQNTFNCFTCGQKGHVSKIPFILKNYMKRKDYLEMAFFIDSAIKSENYKKIGNNIYVEENQYDDNNDAIKEVFDSMVYLNDTMEEFHIMKFIEYDVQKWQIKYNFSDKSVLFPIFDDSNKLINVKARRYINEKKVFYFWKRFRKNFWYGSHFGLDRSKYLFLVEGERDAILLSRYVENVWASMGCPTIEMIKKVPSDKKIVLFFDNDDAGEKNKQKLLKHLNHTVVYVIDKYNFKDPAEVVENKCFDQVIKKIKRVSR